MTERERLYFFEQVKGKKIKYSHWANSYFIPSSLRQEDYNEVMIGEYFCDGISQGTMCSVIGEGFNTCWDGKWELIVENPNHAEEKIEIVKKCTCSSTDLFHFGCKCGGK